MVTQETLALLDELLLLGGKREVSVPPAATY